MRMLLGFVLANVAVASVAAALLLGREPGPPVIQGVFLPQAKPMEEFSLLDHHGEAFDQEDLKGRWHLISYGFTTCPDICPTTLVELDTMKATLGPEGEDLQVLFYSVDHRRDTVHQLASYVPYFNAGFLGLTHKDNPENPHLPFEQSLGIIAELVPSEDPEAGPLEYSVQHGITLFLLNPAGQLQAIFKPVRGDNGLPHFQPEQLAGDYLSIRNYLADS